MKLTACKFIFPIFLSFFLSSCGTIISLAEQDYSVYGGVQRNFAAIEDGGIFSVIAVIDLPLSFVMDTLMLPVTLTQ